MTGVLDIDLADHITTLHIRLERHSIFHLDVSSLAQFHNVRKLVLYTSYKNGGSAIWDRAITLEGLEKLVQLKSLIVYEFPVTLIDMNKLPPNLDSLALYYLWSEKTITSDSINDIPNIRLEIVGPGSYTLHRGIIDYR